MRSYFLQLFPLNPSAIIPSGPTLADLQLEETGGLEAGGLDDSHDAFFHQSA